MTIQVPTRMDDDDVAHLDELIKEGVGETRSQVIRTAVAELYDRHRRARVGADIARSYRDVPQSPADDEWAHDSLDDWLGSVDAPG
jgi:Arc/MetJ-type ribon-helix-helix transcriptional regulator